MNRSSKPLFAAIAAVTFAATACSGNFEEGTEESLDFGTSKEAVINGDASSMDNVVKVYRDKGGGDAGLCTGTLLRNNIVLTAKHCVGTVHGVFNRHYIKTVGGTTKDISNKSQVAEHPDVDMAVLKLDGPVTFGGSSTSAWTSLYDGTTSSLSGANVTCAGYGIKTVDGNDSGTQLQAVLTIASASSTSLKYWTNSKGQILASGDSGGPCFLSSKIVGTTRTADSKCADACQAPVPTNFAWIRDQIGTFLGNKTWEFTATSELSAFDIIDASSSTGGPSSWVVRSGTLDQDSNIAGNSPAPSGSGSMALAKGYVMADGAVQTGVASSDSGSASLILRYKDQNNYYRVTASESGSGIYKVKNGTVTRLVSGPAVNWTSNYTTLVGTSRGTTLGASINGTTISATDSDFDDGRVGLMTSSLEDASFNAFHIIND